MEVIRREFLVTTRARLPVDRIDSFHAAAQRDLYVAQTPHIDYRSVGIDRHHTSVVGCKLVPGFADDVPDEFDVGEEFVLGMRSNLAGFPQLAALGARVGVRRT